MRAAALPLAPTAPTHAPTAGWIAMGLTLLIWASFPLSIRAIGGSALTPVDVALLRFGVPALVLLPVLRSRAAALRALPQDRQQPATTTASPADADGAPLGPEAYDWLYE